jgi:hypothetical protein
MAVKVSGAHISGAFDRRKRKSLLTSSTILKLFVGIEHIIHMNKESKITLFYRWLILVKLNDRNHDEYFPCNKQALYSHGDRLCGLVVRVPGYRSRGPGFESRRYRFFWEVVGLVRGPLSLVRIPEELRSRKPKLTALGIRWADQGTPSNR